MNWDRISTMELPGVTRRHKQEDRRQKGYDYDWDTTHPPQRFRRMKKVQQKVRKNKHWERQRPGHIVS